MTNRQIAWILGGLMLGTITWIVLRIIAHSEGHIHAVLPASVLVVLGGLLGWTAVKILRIK